MNNTVNTKVGILIPTYNRFDFLRQSLDSAKEQTYQALKIMIIDNGSSDRTSEYISGLGDHKISYVRNEANLGLIGSINKGIRLLPADIEWCTILCDDDLLEKTFVQESVSTAMKFAAKSIVHSHRIFIDAGNHRIREALPSPAEESAFDYLMERFKKTRETYLSGVFFRRDAFDSIGGYPNFTTGMASDDAFIFALSLKDRLVHSNKSKAFIRIHEKSESLSCAEPRPILETIKEFEEYCIRAIEENVNLNTSGRKEFNSLVHRYAKTINSECWLQNVNNLWKTLKRNSDISMNEFYSIVREETGYFSNRIRLNAVIYDRFGRNMEFNRFYRKFWNALSYVYTSAHKII